MPNVQNAPKPPGGGFRLVAFPREFEKNLFEDIDQRFYIILLISLALVYGLLSVKNLWKRKKKAKDLALVRKKNNR